MELIIAKPTNPHFAASLTGGGEQHSITVTVTLSAIISGFVLFVTREAVLDSLKNLPKGNSWVPTIETVLTIVGKKILDNFAINKIIKDFFLDITNKFEE